MKKFSLFLLSQLVVFTFSCNKDESNDTPSNSGTYSITLAGQISDENGQGIPNVTVQVGNKTDQTDVNGIYLIEKANVNKTRAVVKAIKIGYWSRSCGFIPSNSTVQYCNMVMPQKSATTGIQSSAGGTVTNTGATITFPSNAFVTSTGVAYNGTVNISSKHLPTSDPNFGALIPGGDLMAEDNNGSSVKLISFGMIGVELKDNNGNALQLTLGVTATIQLPIASAQLAVAPATIPLWYFDETKNLWVEEGIATKVGNKYVGEVAHFSWWNYDLPTPPATISGYVYDNYGNAIVNALIYYNNFSGAITDQNGFYSGQVPSGLTASIYAKFAGNYSPLLSIPSLSAGQQYNVPDIIFSGNSFGKFKANFVDCNNQPINSYVKFNGATSNSFIYAPNGIVNSVIQCGTQTLNAITLNGRFDSTFIQPCFPDSIDFGTTLLCDTSSNSGNIFFKFNLSSSILNVNFLEINPFNIYADCQFLNSIIQIHAYSSITTETFNCFFSGFFNYAPGTYNAPISGLGIEYINGPALYNIYPDTLNPNLNFTIIQNGAVGDTIEIMINGPVMVTDWDSTLVPGTLNNFHVKCIRSL